MNLVGRVVRALGAQPVAVLAWSPTGFDDVVLQLSSQSPPRDSSFEALAAAHRRRIAATPGSLNELRFSPSRLHQRRVGVLSQCSMEGFLTDYASWLAAKQRWELLSVEQRQTACTGGLSSMEAHGIGVAAAVVCSDGKVLVGLRPSTANWYPNHWSVMSEGAQITDVGVSSSGAPEWRPATTADRGLFEELGVRSMRTLWRFFAVVADVHTGSLSVLGRAEIPFSSSHVLRTWPHAPDAEENEDVNHVVWSLPSLDGMESSRRTLVPEHALAVLGAAALDVGWEFCEQRGWLETSGW